MNQQKEMQLLSKKKLMKAESKQEKEQNWRLFVESADQLLLRVPSWYKQCMETNVDSSEYYQEDNMNHSQDE